MSEFWQRIIAMVVKAILEWLTSNEEAKAKDIGAKLAVAEKAYREKAAEIA